jgi:hypothetical protein
VRRPALVALSLTLAACSSGGKPLGGAPTRTFSIAAPASRDVDLLVMVDNSGNMSGLQRRLTAAFSSLTDALQGLAGGPPNLHLAVVSSSMGAGPYSETDIPTCPTGGDRGVFQATPRGTRCATGSLMPGQNFLIANGDGTGNNFTGNLADAFECIASLGDGGCGFEHQLASVLRALGADGAPPPPENANFLRPDAHLFILLLTSEDDCSAPPDSQLFDPASRFVMDPLGPLSSYRCNKFGHLCGGAHPPRTDIPFGGEDLSGTCKASEDGPLLRISDVRARLEGLKAGPSRIHVAALAGPPTPYVVETEPATLKDDPTLQWPRIRPSCRNAELNTAAPAVRIAQLVAGFGVNGAFDTICGDSFQPALASVGLQIAAAISGTLCLDAGIDPTACTAVDEGIDAQGRVETPLPKCADGGSKAPCWEGVRTLDLCGGGPGVTFKRAQPPAAELTTVVTCPR